MSALRDLVINSSIDDLVDMAERGDIDPDELWQEVLDSLDRSTAILRSMGVSPDAASRRATWLSKIQAKQDRIDDMIERWSQEISASGLAMPDPAEPIPAKRA